MRSLHSCAVIAAIATGALADVQFLSPKAGASIPVGTLSITWEDSGDSPSIDALSTYTLQVMLGGNGKEDWQGLTTVTGNFATGNKASITGITPELAASTKNGFYLKMISTAKDGGTITNYSDRFTITGMTGNTPPQFVTAINAIDGTKGPETENNIANDAAAGAGAGAGAAAGPGGVFGVPYAEQTGLTKYAPMQSVPPTKITLKGYTPLYPTSAFKIATAPLAPGSIATTITQSQTFSVAIQENTASRTICLAAAQAGPQNDMEKFLARWKD